LNLIGDQQRKVPLSRHTILVASLCGLLAVEVLGAYILKTSAPARQRRKVASEIRQMRRATADIQKMRDKNRAFRKQLYQLEQVCGTRAGSMEILKGVSDTLPEDTYLRQIDCSMEEIRLRGYSKEPGRIPALVMTMPFVDTISTSDIGSEQNDYYQFALSASLRR
jgi:Tfp pilus assembly protein PilN